MSPLSNYMPLHLTEHHYNCCAPTEGQAAMSTIWASPDHLAEHGHMEMEFDFITSLVVVLKLHFEHRMICFDVCKVYT